MSKDAPTLAGRKIMRELRRQPDRVLHRGRDFWIWNDAAVDGLIRRGLVEGTEHGMRKRRHRVLAIRLTPRGREWRELQLVRAPADASPADTAREGK